MSFVCDPWKCSGCGTEFPTTQDYRDHRYFNCKNQNPPPAIEVRSTSVAAERDFLTRAKTSGLTLAEAQAFVGKRLNVNCLDDMGRNALFYLAMNESKGTVEDGVAQFLVDQGLNVEVVDICHDTAIFYAAKNKAYKIWKLLFECGLDPGTSYLFDIDDPHVLPLRPGAEPGNREATEKLKKVLRNQEVDAGEVIDALLDGADPNVTNGFGDPALVQVMGKAAISLANKGVTEVAYALVAYGADVTKKGPNYNALSMCMTMNWKEFYDFLCKSRGIQPNWAEFERSNAESRAEQAQFLQSVSHLPMMGRRRRP